MESLNIGIVENFKSLHPLLVLAVFIAYFLIDAFYAKYTIAIADRQAVRAATIGALMHFLLAIGVLSYVENYLYVLPIAVGSWLGTYYAIRTEKVKVINTQFHD